MQNLTAAMKLKGIFYLGRKAIRSLDSILKIRDIALPTKVPIIKAMVFLVVKSRCVSWTIKKTEGWRIGAFEMWSWRRLWRVPWTVKRSNQSILRESTLDIHSVQFSSVQSLSRVRLFVTPWIAACQASLSITNSRSLLKLVSIKSVMPSSHLILCHHLLLLPPIPPSIRVFSMNQLLVWGGQSIGVSASALLGGLSLKEKLQHFGHLMIRADLLKKKKNLDAGKDWRQKKKKEWHWQA